MTLGGVVRPGSAALDGRDWFTRRTFRDPVDLGALLALKDATSSTISVCIPVRDEAATIAPMCTTITTDLVAPGLIDELLVLDGASVDGTAEIAASAGATVLSVADVEPVVEPAYAGKGDALWKSVAAARGDIVVWLDGDVTNFNSGFVTRLVAPLLRDDSIVLCKGFYERRDAVGRSAGGRITELLTRPLVNLLFAELSGFIQPLGGEAAGRVTALREVPFQSGYGVELGLLIDLSARFGVNALAQVDLGSKAHRNRDLLALGSAAFEIARVAIHRASERDSLGLDELPPTFTQFVDGVPHSLTMPMIERPALATSGL